MIIDNNKVIFFTLRPLYLKGKGVGRIIIITISKQVFSFF